jgi:hypothetical protein
MLHCRARQMSGSRDDEFGCGQKNASLDFVQVFGFKGVGF